MNPLNSESKITRTRFAPSPTGLMHVGGVRTALFAWLVARQAGGQFILRIEDTDKVREVEGSEAHIIECLRWLGLNWDEGVDKGGDHGPYKQSQRLDTYKEWGQKLVAAGRAYADTTTKEELDGLREEAKQQKKPFLFRDHRPENPPGWDGSMPLRFKSEPKSYQWHDAVMGDLAAGPEAVDDFILIKGDGYPTYNFAHIIDDHLMQITHVMRSQEFLSSVPRFLDLYEALEIERPIIATLPYVMGPDGNKKLSKRDGAKDILDYRDEGYLPAALINFMATLGWNDGSEQEIFSVDELISKFDLSRVQRSGARFDQQRLTWMNGHYIRQLSSDELLEKIEPFWAAAKGADEDYKKAILALVQERLKFFSEIDSLSAFFFAKPKDESVLNLYTNPQDKQLKMMDRAHMKQMLGEASQDLATSNFSRDDIQERLNSLLASLETKPAVLFPLIRIALSGQISSPEIFGTLAVLGKEESLARLQTAIALLDS